MERADDMMLGEKSLASNYFKAPANFDVGGKMAG